MSFIKKNFICKEKSGTGRKVKLVAKIKKHNQLCFGTLVFASKHWLQRKQQHGA